MQVETQLKIRSNPHLYQYLRENSYWYKYLNRNPSFIKEMEEEMRKRYKMTAADKMENISRTISLVQTFMNVMR